MDIARGHLAKMTIMSLLITILEVQVHCSTQPQPFIPPTSSSTLDVYLHHLTQLEEYVPISLATQAGSSVDIDHFPRGSSVDLDHFSPHGIPEEIEKARNYPWSVLLGWSVEVVAMRVEEIIPSASIVVKKDDLPAYVLQNKGLALIAVLATNYDDIVYFIVVGWNNTQT